MQHLMFNALEKKGRTEFNVSHKNAVECGKMQTLLHTLGRFAVMFHTPPPFLEVEGIRIFFHTCTQESSVEDIVTKAPCPF